MGEAERGEAVGGISFGVCHRDQVTETLGGAHQKYPRRPVEVGRLVLTWELKTSC
jgi:hypothetical protein